MVTGIAAIGAGLAAIGAGIGIGRIGGSAGNDPGRGDLRKHRHAPRRREQGT